MKRIGILTAGGDTPALNATLYGAVVRANQCKVEVLGFIKGFSSLFNPRVPYVRLNPLLTTIPELAPDRGGTIIGASRDYVDPKDRPSIQEIADRMRRLQVEGLICIGGDGTLSGMQVLSDFFPTVLAPKTIDNDLGLNYRHEPDEWQRETTSEPPGYRYVRTPVPRAVRSRPDCQLRHAGLRHGRLRVGHRRATRADHGREPSPHRHCRGHGPPFRLPGAGSGLWPARYRPDS